MDHAVTLLNIPGVCGINAVGKRIMAFYIQPLNKRIQQKNRAGGQFHPMDAAAQTHHQKAQQQIQHDGNNLGKLNDVKLLVRGHQDPMGHTPIIAE